MPFISRKIGPQTLGDILQRARLSHGWQLRDVERRIGISAKYLEFLEDDDFYKLPSPTYTNGFLSRYARFLQLNPEEIIKQWKEESYHPPGRKTRAKKARQLPLVGFKKSRFLFNLNIKIILIGLMALAVLVYLGLGVKKILLPPQIEIFSPPDDLITKELSLVVEGKTQSSADVFINQEPVSQFFKGYFRQNLELLPGLNIIEISAKKKYSRQRIVRRRVVVEE